MAHLTEAVGAPVQRVYAIGDIHGRFDLFREMIYKIEQDQSTRPPASTRIILLGDIVDRGPDTARLVQGCMALTASTDRFVVLKGNHEEMMVEALRGNRSTYEAWLGFGGRETLLSWGVDPEMIAGPPSTKHLRNAATLVGHETLEWLATLPLIYRHETYLFVHAGIRPGVPVDRQQSDDLLWIKDDFLSSTADHGYTIVHGHSAEAEVVVHENRIGLDTGAYRTGRLSAIGIENGKSWMLNTDPEADARYHISRDAAGSGNDTFSRMETQQ